MASCAHPFARVDFSDASQPRCTRCHRRLTYPAAYTRQAPPPNLVHATRRFIAHIKSQEAGEQLNPRAELQLILEMSDALHAHDALQGGSDGSAET